MREHVEDEYVRRARREGYRTRAVYKLMEMDKRDHLLKPGLTVVDLGAAPGSWSVYAAKRVGTRGRVIAVDRLAIAPMAGVEFISGDFTEQAVWQRLLRALDEQPVDLVLSDMAPNISGIISTDQARAMHLSELAWDLAQQVLRPGGVLLTKAFQGVGFPELQKGLYRQFSTVRTRKPRASRSRSREIYLLAKGFKGSKPA